MPNTEIFRRLAARFGYDDPAFQATDLELIDDALDASDARMQGVQPSKIPAGETMHMRLADGPMIAFKNVFPSTPSGKVELYSEDLEERFGAGLPVYTEVPAAFPLQLITPSSSHRTNATFGGVTQNREMEVIELNPVSYTHLTLPTNREV